MSRYLDPKADVPEIAKAIELAEESAYTPGELNLYESYWDQVSREKTLFNSKYAEGEAMGRMNEKREMAKKLLRRKVSIDIIVEDTELTREEVLTIQFDLDQSQ